MDEVVDLLARFEQQLRWLADRREHDRRGSEKEQAESLAETGRPTLCNGAGGCVKCSMLARADRIADILSGPDVTLMVSDTVGVTQANGVTRESVAAALRVIADAPPEMILAAVKDPETLQRALLVAGASRRPPIDEKETFL